MMLPTAELGPPQSSPEHGVVPELAPNLPAGRETHHLGARRPIHDVYAAPMPQMPAMPAPQYPWPVHTEAVGGFEHGGMGHAPLGHDESNGHSLALSIVLVGAGAAVGAKYGGLPGAGAGVLAGGALANTWRALSHFKLGSEAGDKEGRVSAVYALLGAAAGGLIWWRYVETPKAMYRNPDDDDDADALGFDEMPCRIRPAGP